MKFRFALSLVLFFYLTSCFGINSTSQLSPEIGAWGPLSLEKGNPADEYYFSRIESPEEKIKASIVPSNNQFLVYPNTPLAAGATYRLSVEGNLEPVVNKIDVREPCIVYLGEPDGKSEVLKRCLGEAPLQLTRTEGSVDEFTVSRTGDWIFYTADNNNGGNEIWRISPDGTGLRKVHDCSQSKCSDLDFNSITKKLVFTQSGNDAQIKVFDLFSETITDIESSGSELSLSPDGRYISYIENQSGQLTVINLADRNQISSQSGSGLVGEWSRDSSAILFGEMEFWGGIPGVKVYELQLGSGVIKAILYDPNQELEFYQPRYTRNDGVYLASVRQRSAGASRQFWLLKEGAEGVKQITNDPLYHYSFPSWSPDYSELVFQRFPVNESDGCPQVVVWNQDSDTFQVIAENAAMPYWLP